LTLHGRTFLLFFAWLISLEIIMGWEKFETIRLNKLKSVRTVLFVVALLLPTVYVIVENYCGLNLIIEDIATRLNVLKASWPTVSVEYIVFMIFLVLIVLLLYGISGLPDFSVSILFAGTIGTLFIIDNLYPYGKFTPLQILVPATTAIVAYVFNLMGYTTSITYENSPTYGSYPYLKVTSPQGGKTGLGIAWPCSGIESLIIYAVTVVLFLKKLDVSFKIKVFYFVVGAIVTYFINIFRVVTLFLLALEYGVGSPPWQRFHDYYGMLYSVAWIVAYPLIIIGSQALWHKIESKLAQRTNFHTEIKGSQQRIR
jgi:thaumarchaeosortase